LNNEVEEFLIHKKVMSRTVEKELLLLQVLRERQLHKLFFQKASLLEKNWEKISNPRFDSAVQKYQFSDIVLTHPQFDRFDFDIKDKLLKSLKNLDDFYIRANLMNVVDYLGFILLVPDESHVPIQEKLPLLNPLIELVENGTIDDSPIAEICVDFFRSVNRNEYSSYDKVKKIYRANFEFFSEREHIDIFRMLGHYCARNHALKRDGVLSRMFDDYAFAIEHGILVEDGCINRTDFINVINLAIHAGDSAYARKFVSEYSCYLEEEVAEDLVLLAEAKLLFMEEKYDEVLAFLVSVKFHFFSFGVEARIVLLKCYYILGEDYEDLLENMFKSFRLFLNRQETEMDIEKSSALNFISFCQKLYQKRHDPNDQTIGKLKDDLLACSNLYSRPWLLSELGKLKKK